MKLYHFTDRDPSAHHQWPERGECYHHIAFADTLEEARSMVVESLSYKEDGYNSFASDESKAWWRTLAQKEVDYFLKPEQWDVTEFEVVKGCCW